MPVSPERRELYPADWPAISATCKQAARWRCLICGHPDDPAGGRGLTVHHFDDDPANNEPWNLHPLCQSCHLTIEAAGSRWSPFSEQTRPAFPPDPQIDPFGYWFAWALDRYRRHHPDGGRTRPRPKRRRNPPTSRPPAPNPVQRELPFDADPADGQGRGHRGQ